MNEYKEFIESKIDFWNGNIGFSKNIYGKVFSVAHGGAFVGVAGIFYSAITAAGHAAIPIVFGSVGAGVIGRLAMDQYQKLKLNKELNKILRKFIDLHSVPDDEELLELLDQYSFIELDQEEQLRNMMGVEEVE